MKNSVKLLNRRQKKLLYQLFFSYIIFLLIPIFLLSILTNYNIINYSKEKITSSNQLKLQILQDSIDMYFKEVKNCAITIANDRRTDNAHNVKRSDSPYSYDTVLKVMDVMQLFRETWGLKNYIHSIYIYNQDEQVIISSMGGLYEAENFYDTAWINSVDAKNSYEIYTTNVRKPSNPNIKKSEKMPGCNEDVITFIFPLKYIRLRGAIAINVKYDMLFKDLNSSMDSSEFIFVIEQQGKMLFNGLNEEKNADIDTSVLVKDVVNHSENHGYYTYCSKDKEYMVTFRKSNVSNLAVIDLVHVSFLFDKIFLFRTLLIALSASILFVGLIISYFMSRRIYNPIRKMLEELKSHIIVDPNYKKNELTLIYDAVNELINKEKETDQIINMNKVKLMEAHVTGLVMGKANEEVAEYSFLEEYNCCLLISIDRYKIFLEEYTHKEQQYYKSIILSVSNRIVNTYAKGFSAVLNMDRVVTIISVKEDQKNQFYTISKSICDRLFAEMSVTKDFSISIALGGLYPGSEKVYKSFMEAEKALNYRFFYGHACCVRYDEIKTRNETCHYFNTKDSYIINYLKSNSNKEILEIIHDFAKYLKRMNDVNYESVVQTVIHLVSRTTEYLASLNITIDNIFEENSNVFLEIMRIETLDDMREWLCSFYDRIMAYLLYHTQSTDNKKYIQEVIDIIEKNYMWGDLNIQWVCEQLNISYSHLRRVFKEEIGMNFVDYLNRIRIEHAKSLLANSDMTVVEIAARSGYNNDQCFNRFFKKYEGITPGKYRTNCMELGYSVKND